MRESLSDIEEQAYTALGASLIRRRKADYVRAERWLDAILLASATLGIAMIVGMVTLL